MFARVDLLGAREEAGSGRPPRRAPATPPPGRRASPTRRRIAAAALFVVGLVLAGIAFVAGTESEGVSTREVTDFGEVPVAKGGSIATTPRALEPPAEPTTPVLPVTSGLISAIDADGPPAPVRLRIGELAVDSPVVGIGYDADTGEVEIPASLQTVGWYRFGPAPGEEGSSVLTAHVDWGGEAGAFYFLHELDEGDIVHVDYEDGTTGSFRVVAGRMYHKAVLPTDDLFRTTGAPVLALVTCGGNYVDEDNDYQSAGYQNNVVIYAVPVDLGTASAA